MRPASLSLRRFALSTPSYRAFSSSPLYNFRNTPATMVVNEIKGKAEFDAQVLKSDKLVLVDAFAEWCGPCKAIAPVINRLSDDERFKNDVSFVKFDVDDSPDVAQELGISAMPTFLFFKNGEQVDKVVGAVPQAIEAAISKNL